MEKDYSKLTLIEKLRLVGDLKPGDAYPTWLGPGDWGTSLSEICREAADKLEKLEHIQNILDKIDNYPP